jgi:acyl carrier protein
MTTLERLTKILVDKYKIDPERLTPQQPLAALGMDSLGMVELLFMIEDEFNVKLPQDVDTFPTLADAVLYVDALLAAHAVQGSARLPHQPA